jgi:hypothetical protein
MYGSNEAQAVERLAFLYALLTANRQGEAYDSISIIVLIHTN